MASREQEVWVPLDGGVVLEGNLSLPDSPRGLVLFAHGSGSSRHSPRNRFVAAQLQDAGFATLLIDLCSNVDLLAQRLIAATNWVRRDRRTTAFDIGYFGSSTGAAAALVAAALEPSGIGAVVSRGGRPDLAADELHKVRAPTLLIVGGDDVEVLQLNLDALRMLQTEKELEIVRGATHLFEERGALERVAALASRWFVRHLAAYLQPGAEYWPDTA